MNAATFLDRVNYIVTGSGYKVEKPVPVHNFFLSSSGAHLTTTLTTNPGFDVFETNLVGLTWAAAKVVKAGFNFVVPGDYDKDGDYLKVKVKALMSGSTDTPAIDCTAYLDSDPSTNLDPDESDDLSDEAAWVEIDLSDNSLEAGDVLTINLFPEAHGTDAVEVYGVSMEYKSTLAYYDASNR